EEIELEHVVAEGPDPEVVLPVDVHGDAAAQGRPHRAGHHCRPVAVFDRAAPQPLDGHPRLGLEDTRRRLPAKHSVQPGGIDDEATAMNRSISVAPPRTPEGKGKAFLPGPSHQLTELLDAPWRHEAARAADGSAES